MVKKKYSLILPKQLSLGQFCKLIPNLKSVSRSDTPFQSYLALHRPILNFYYGRMSQLKSNISGMAIDIEKRISDLESAYNSSVFQLVQQMFEQESQHQCCNLDISNQCLNRNLNISVAIGILALVFEQESQHYCCNLDISNQCLNINLSISVAIWILALVFE